MSPDRKINSPFRYPGGKFYARKSILEYIPQSAHYCEPFAGGASIFFAKPLSAHNTLNDLDGDVANTLIQIRDNVEPLIELLNGVEATKELHYFMKNKYPARTKLQKAFRWFYLNRTSYSGIMKPENCYWGFGKKYSMVPENWPNHLRKVSEKLQGVEILAQDFKQVIDSLPDYSFMFVDPPYYHADQGKFYNCAFTLEDHKRLSKCLYSNTNRLSFLITYDNVPEVKALYKWCAIMSQEWQYTINRTDDQKNGKKLADGHKGRRGMGKELFISNSLSFAAA